MVSCGQRHWYKCAKCYKVTEFTIEELPNGKLEIIDTEMLSTEITIPSTLNNKDITNIGYNAFIKQSTMEIISISEKILEINSSAFNFSPNLIEFKVAYYNPVFRAINRNLYDKLGFTLIRIPRGRKGSEVTGGKKIADYALYKCSNILSLSIDPILTSIGDYAFSEMIALKQIFIDCTIPPRINSTVFGTIDRSKIIIYLYSISLKQVYINAGWSGFNFIEY